MAKAESKELDGNTEEVTFEKFDKLGRKKFALRLTNVIAKFYPFADGAYVLSLNAKFGSGKTTFLKMWKAHLIKEGYEVIYINAWESDFDDEPIVPIATSLMDNISKDGVGAKTKAALMGVIGIGALVGNTVVKHTTGIDVQKTMEELEKNLNEDALQKIGQELSHSFFRKKEVYRRLRECLKEYVAKLQGKPLIILIDELDRVRPDYSIRFLEAIKHIFSVRGVCFVIAVDRHQLEKSVKQLYGDIDFDNYYRRFITREAELLEPDEINWQEYIEQLGKEYFDAKLIAGVQFAFSETQKREVLEFIAYTGQAFGLTPRQAEHLIRIYSQFMAITPSNQQYEPTWLIMPIIMIGIYIKNKNLYHELGRGECGPEKLDQYIGSLDFSWNNAEDTRRIITLDSVAWCLSSGNQQFQKEAIRVFRRMVPQTNLDDQAILRTIAGYSDRHGSLRPKSRFQNLYKQLEEWRSFIE